MKLKALILAASLTCAGLSACSSGGGGDSRTVQVDYQTDDVAGIFLGYYPRAITVKPGMTVKFEQTWTGEPHSVTLGTIVEEGYKPIRKLVGEYINGTTPIPDAPPAEYVEEVWDERLPFMLDEEVNQSAALPCFAPKESDMPKDKTKPCAKKFREEQPPFDGSHAYYSSGFIPFEGELANKFELEIAEDTPDGTYGYYCNLHGVLMSGEITVDKDADVESQGDINRRGRDEAERAIALPKKVYEQEKTGKGAFALPLAGSGNEETDQVMAGINEFTPRTIEAKVGEKVTWTFINDHTITFNVPAYSPLFVFDKKTGFLEFNEGLDSAKGGWPGPPEEEEGPPEGGEGGGPPPERDPVSLDAGEWDGSGGIKSSGSGFSTGDKYSVTFTKAGTYPYACLIHPGQIGKVVVK